ncbi:MAG: polymerase, sigma-24 subunit, subfamily [Chitinophagaceae bacterium]|nr:polymerase, sigma-24 subunit, subfamily [Chitinophagaceae bacterium]
MSPLQTLDDPALLTLLKEGNAAAFDVLYSRYWDRVLNLAYRKTGDLMEAENIIQDVFVSLWTRRDCLNINGNFSNYLFVSVKYRVLKVLARQKTEQAVNIDQAGELLDDSTQEYLTFEDIRERLEVLIGNLPEKSRLIYLLKSEDKSYKEIAAELNMTEKAVDAHLLRARRKLRVELGSFLGTFLL